MVKTTNLKQGCNKFLDLIFILSFSIGYASLIKYITYAIFPFPESIELFLFLSIVYFLRFKFHIVKNSVILRNKLLYILLFLYLWEFVQGTKMGTDINAILVGILILCSSFVGFQYFLNIIEETNSIDRIFSSYCFYSFYSFYTILLLVFLILLGIVYPFTNQLTTNSLFRANMETSDVIYYFPAYLSIVSPSPSVFLSGLNLPTFSGLSHEPQAMFYAIFPAVFLFLYKFRNTKNIEIKILIFFLIISIMTTSLTAVLCFAFTFLIHLFWRFKQGGQRKYAVGTVLLIVIGLIIFIESNMNTKFQSFMLEKTNFDADYSSGSYSLSLLTYIFSPTSFFGEGIFGSTADQASKMSINCGYISSCFMILFFITFLITTMKNIFSKRLLCHSIGLACLYFILHSLKYGIALFNSTYVFFIVFLLCYSDYQRKLN